MVSSALSPAVRELPSGQGAWAVAKDRRYNTVVKIGKFHDREIGRDKKGFFPRKKP